MAIPKLGDLEGYVKKGGRSCSTCTSEHRTFIEQAYAQNYGFPTIVRYLNDQFDAGMAAHSVRRHFYERHHETKAKTKRA